MINGSYVNQTVTKKGNGTVMNVTQMETVLVTETYAWWDKNGEWQYALNGADVVEYHNIDSSANAVAGSVQFETEIYGIKWLFKDQANKDLFDADPASYVPEYGGIAIALNAIVFICQIQNDLVCKVQTHALTFRNYYMKRSA